MEWFCSTVQIHLFIWKREGIWNVRSLGPLYTCLFFIHSLIYSLYELSASIFGMLLKFTFVLQMSSSYIKVAVVTLFFTLSPYFSACPCSCLLFCLSNENCPCGWFSVPLFLNYFAPMDSFFMLCWVSKWIYNSEWSFSWMLDW